MSLKNEPIVTSGYAPINGLNMYYEIHGAGQPLVLIHGGFGVVSMFAQFLPDLVATRQVIAVELQGHGHTADLDRPFSYEQFGDDIAALIKHLGLKRADVMGYSLGGGAALQTAIRHPDVVRKLIVLSAPHKRAGWFPDVLVGMGSVNGEALMGSPMHAGYVSVAPNPNGFVALANKTRQLLSEEYDWSVDLAAIDAPTLIVAGDADSISPTTLAEMFGLCGGGKKDAGWQGLDMSNSRLAILPGTTHYNILAAPGLAAYVTAFLDAILTQKETNVNTNMDPQLIAKPAFTVVGLLLQTTAKSPEIPKLWDQLVSRMGEIEHGNEAHVSYGLMDHFDRAAGTMDYMAGNPVAQALELPTGMSRWDVPANTYAVFETTIPKIGETFDYAFGTWLPTSGYRQVAAPYFERYGADFSPQNPVVSIYLPVEKKA